MDQEFEVLVHIGDQHALVRTRCGQSTIRPVNGPLDPSIVGQPVLGLGIPAGTRLAYVSSDGTGVLTQASTLGTRFGVLG